MSAQVRYLADLAHRASRPATLTPPRQLFNGESTAIGLPSRERPSTPPEATRRPLSHAPTGLEAHSAAPALTPPRDEGQRSAGTHGTAATEPAMPPAAPDGRPGRTPSPHPTTDESRAQHIHPTTSRTESRAPADTPPATAIPPSAPPPSAPPPTAIPARIPSSWSDPLWGAPAAAIAGPPITDSPPPRSDGKRPADAVTSPQAAQAPALRPPEPSDPPSAAPASPQRDHPRPERAAGERPRLSIGTIEVVVAPPQPDPRGRTSGQPPAPAAGPIASPSALSAGAARLRSGRRRWYGIAQG